MTTPANARLQFRLRTLVNCGIVLLIFVPSVFLFELLPWSGLTIISLIAVLYYLFFYVLEKRAIGIACPKCEKHISTNTPWVCGFCQQANRNIDKFPFVHRCEHCEAEPKAYQCHHCGKLIFLDADELAQNYARCLNAPIEDRTKEEVTEQEREKRKLQHELIITRLTTQLNDARSRLNPPPEKAPREMLEESFSRHKDRMMTIHEIASREKKANAEQYKDDPDMLERANASVDFWLGEHI